MTPGETFAFGSFRLDTRTRRLHRDGDPVALSARALDLLCCFVADAGRILTKDALIAAAWPGVAVTDNSLEQAISGLRRILGALPDGQPYIETHARRGYRFAADVVRIASRETDEALDELLAPHRAWLDGRAALETLERDEIVRARTVFEGVLGMVPDQASAHVGLANACAMEFEMTRTDEAPDARALARAVHHAREGCRLDPASGEAWATLGFVLERTGHHADALAAARRAVTVEPDNWHHHLRLGYTAWGEQRLRAARRTLALLPGFPLAHWLAASVHVARQALEEAERELEAGIADRDGGSSGQSRFSGVALHWLLGLVHLARGDDGRALAEFERELSLEGSGHLYARESCANAWYATGALRLRQGRHEDAVAAFRHAVARVGRHPMARAALAGLGAGGDEAITRLGTGPGSDASGINAPSLDAVMARAVHAVLLGAPADAATLVDQALSAAAPGSAAWSLPVEPVLNTAAHPGLWAAALARVRTRAT